MVYFDLFVEQRFSVYWGLENKWFESLLGQFFRVVLWLLDVKLVVVPCVFKSKCIHERFWMIFLL